MKKDLEWPYYHTIKEYFDRSIDLFEDNEAFVDLKDNYTLTYGQIGNKVIRNSYALKKMFDFNKTHCAIYSENCALYMVAYFTVINADDVVILIDNELNNETLFRQINYADCEVVFLSEKNKKKIDLIKENCPKVKQFIILKNEDDEQYLTLKNLEEKGDAEIVEAKKFHDELEPDENAMCEILFTSGTTGANKGAMLSNKNVCCSIYASIVHLGTYDNTISILPFYHAYESACHVLPGFCVGVRNYINDSLIRVANNLKSTPAEITVVVPMVLDLLATRIKSESKRRSLWKYLRVGMVVSKGLRGVGIDLREQFFKPVFASTSQTLRTFVVGGAQVSAETYDFLTALGFKIINGYGATECSPLIASYTPFRQGRFSVGKVVPNMEVKIGETDENGNGEIMVKGDGVMLGYYKDIDATNVVIDSNGWLHTGDLGHIDNNNYVYICGRIKNLIILPNGKNVYPEELEQLLLDDIKAIKEVIVYDDEKQTGIYATVVLDEEYSKGKEGKQLYNEIKQEIVNFNKKMPAYKRITDFRIRRKPFNKNTSKKIIRSKENIETND